MLPPEEGSAPPPSDTDLPPWETGPEPAPTDSPQLSVPEEKPTNHNAVSPKASAPGDWEGFLRTLKEIPPMANSFLRKRDSVNGIFADGILTLWVDSELTKGVLSRGETLAVLERAALAYTGEPYRVTLKVGEPDIPAEPVAPAAVQDDGFNDLLDLGRQFGNFTVK